MQISPNLQPGLARVLAMTPDLRRAIGLLRLSNLELAAELARLGAQNRQIRVIGPLTDTMTALWPPRRQSAGPPPPASLSSGGVSDVIEATHSIADSLHEHAHRQVGLLFRDPEARQIAGHFVNALEPSGWLGLSLTEIAQEAGCVPAVAEAVLSRIQQAEPAGLFARNLAECLELQASEAGLLTPVFATVLANLPLLAQGRIAALAELAGCSTDQVETILAAIRRFDPKPGARFDPAPPPLREPDLIIRRRKTGWMVGLNHETLPGIMVLDDAKAAADDMQAARWLDHALARRNATLLAIGEAVVIRQTAYLTEGAAALRPMRLADLARDCDLHESTVSRAAAGLLIQTPKGIVGLHDLCGAGFDSGSSAGPVSAGAIRHHIARIIAAEAPDTPLSDAALSDRLAGLGITVARRTIAKYRQQQGIPPASARRARRHL